MSGNDEAGCGCFVLVVIAFALIGVQAVPSELEQVPVKGTISDTYTKGGDSAKYFVAINVNGQDEVFENRDSLMQGKFNSADVQQQVKRVQEQGKEICVVVNGRRFPFMSWFRNVLKVVPC